MTFIRLGARLWWGLVPLLLLLWGSGALAMAVIPGLPESPLATLVAVPVLSFMRMVAITLAIGAMVVRVLVPAQAARSWAMSWSLAAIVLCVGNIAALRSDIAASGLLAVNDGIGLDQVVAQVGAGRALAVEICCLVLAIIFVAATDARAGSLAAVVIASIGAAVPSIMGHAGLSGGHSIAAVSIGLHVMSICLWVGGLAAVLGLIALDSSSIRDLLHRFSSLALVCAIVAGETGLLTATIISGSLTDLLGSEYGSIILVKCLLFAWLVLLGWKQRRRVMDRLEEANAPSSLAALAGVELLVMGSAIAAATVLARIGPSPIPGTGMAPLAVVVLAIGVPSLLAFVAPASWGWIIRVPEVLAIVLVIAIVEVAGVGLARTLLGPVGLVLEAAILVAVGWVAVSAIRASHGAQIILACGIPVGLLAAAWLSARPSGIYMWIVAILAAEVALVAGRGRRTVDAALIKETVS